MLRVSYIRCLKELLCLRHARTGVAFIKCSYARGSRGWKQQYNPNHFHIQNELESVEEDFDQQMDNPNLLEDVVREEESRRRKIKLKIIERKYFKKPQEINLLTWDAKEQIRFLNNEFPTEWTIDRIAESFPISREGAIKLLKSKFVPRTVQNIIQHDERVQKNWKALKSKHGDKGGPIMNRYQTLLKEGKLYTLANAGGIANLPKPEIRRFLPVQKDKVPGVYELIVKDYCEKKAKEKVETEKSTMSDTELYSMHRKNSQTFLDGVTSAVIPKSLPNCSNVHSSTGKTAVQGAKSVDYASFINNDDTTESQEESDSHDLQTMLDASISESDNLLTNRNRRSPRLKQTLRSAGSEPRSESPHIPNQIENLQMQGTGKVSTESSNGNEKDQDSLDTTQRDGTQRDGTFEDGSLEDSNDGPDEAVLDALQYDTETNTAYIYNEDAGYQHPFGKQDNQEQKIKIPKHLEGMGQLFKKGVNYYDEDGEFLFRVPGQE